MVTHSRKAILFIHEIIDYRNLKSVLQQIGR